MRGLVLGLVVMLTACATLQDKGKVIPLASPNGQLMVDVHVQTGALYYTISKNKKEILEASKLGVTLDRANFVQSLTLVSTSAVQPISDYYTLRHGKKVDIAYHANERVLTLANSAGQKMNVRFRVSDDGVAFRYEFLGESDEPYTVEQEFTSFNMPASAKAWLQPVAVAKTGWNSTNPSYEEHYQLGIDVDQASPTEAGWAFPALFHARGQWVAITEAGMTGEYHASRLQSQSFGGNYRIGFPMAEEVFTGGALKAQASLPFRSPWRIVTVGSLNTLVQSTLGTDLADPAIAPMPFAQPGLVSWSWALLKDESVNFETSKAFIDYAADMGWPYTLIDADWDRRIGEDKIQELARYAAQKNVGLLLWYNSAGDWNTTPLTPKSVLLDRAQRRAEFAKLQQWGIRGVKIDFFAGDGQSMMAYYNALAKDAADFDLMVNYHGSSLPRGLARTYPNMMTMEAVHGFEMITFNQSSADAAPSFMTVLPFARNLFDPMDFTPTTFFDIPERERKTTNGAELAQPVLFLSGLQHIAETPENMAKVPEYVKNAMKSIPVGWDESRLVQGFPGKEVVIARRKGSVWYVAGINGEPMTKHWELDLSFIETKGTVITDGQAPFSFVKQSVLPKTATKITVQPNGGFLMVFGKVL